MIQIEGLTKRFGAQLVLNQLALNVEAGERIALIGQNGSGKTTLIRCILGLYSCDGALRVLGKAPRQARQELLTQIGFVPQQAPGIRSSVSEFLLATTRLCGVDGAAIMAVAERLGLSIPQISQKAFYALSGGMKQKLLISIALARRPKLLIMDEPAANLDPIARAAFFSLLEELDPTTAMLLSSHRIDEVSGLVTRLIELDAGRLVLDDLVSVQSRSLGARLRCSLKFSEAHAHVLEALAAWGLSSMDDGRRWEGLIAAHDQFRFVCLIARWSGLIERFNMEELIDETV